MKERNGKGSSGAEKREATQDDQPVAATRSKRKVSDSKDHQVATQLRKKAAPKSKHSRK